MSNKGSSRINEWIEDQGVPPCDNNSVRSHSTTDSKRGKKKKSLLMRAMISLGSPSVRENTSQANSAKRSIKSSSTVQSASRVPPQKDDASQAGSSKHSIKSSSSTLRDGKSVSKAPSRKDNASNGTIRSGTHTLVSPGYQQDANAPLPPRSYQGTSHSSIASERALSQYGSVQGSVASGSYSGNIPVVPRLPSPFRGDFSGSTYKESASATERQGSHHGAIFASPNNGDNGSLVISLPTSHHRDADLEPGDITCTLTQLHVHISGKKKSSTGKGSSR